SRATGSVGATGRAVMGPVRYHREPNCTNCTNCTRPTSSTAVPPSSSPNSSGDFAGGFASARPVLLQELLDPAGRGEPARLVRRREESGNLAPESHRLLRGKIPRELIEQADELTDVRGARNPLLTGEPALELRAGGTAGSRSVEEVPQAVRAQGDLRSRLAQREPGRLARDRITQEGNWERRDVTPATTHSVAPGCASCGVC